MHSLFDNEDFIVFGVNMLYSFIIYTFTRIQSNLISLKTSFIIKNYHGYRNSNLLLINFLANEISNYSFKYMNLRYILDI